MQCNVINIIYNKIMTCFLIAVVLILAIWQLFELLSVYIWHTPIIAWNPFVSAHRFLGHSVMLWVTLYMQWTSPVRSSCLCYGRIVFISIILMCVVTGTGYACFSAVNWQRTDTSVYIHLPVCACHTNIPMYMYMYRLMYLWSYKYNYFILMLHWLFLSFSTYL